MNILEKIVAHKKAEVNKRKAMYPIALLEESIFFNTPVVSLTKYLLRQDKTGIIAEFKRRSPSEGDINIHASVEKVSIGYMQAGASALSILTDEQFFGGKNADLTMARQFNFCPVLRKDFIIDEYQLIEARSIGADTVLLIAECLSKTELAKLAGTARRLGLEVLMEVHAIEELNKLTPDVNIVGVNNRNLKDFSIDTAISLELAKGIPDEFVKVSESGLNDPAVVVELKQNGFQGFLIGGHFMKNADPPLACSEFIQEIHRLEAQLIKKTI